MEFINNNLETILSLFFILLNLILGWIIIPFMKKNKLLSQEKIDMTKRLVGMLELVNSNVKYSNNNIKDKTSMILKFAEHGTNYVEQVMKSESNENKKLIAIETTVKLLEQSGVYVDDKLLQLIQIGIESAVSKLPKTNLDYNLLDDKPVPEGELK